MRKFPLLLLPVFLVACLAGCASSVRGPTHEIFDIKTVQNPVEGPAVRIGEIRDVRKFEKTGILSDGFHNGSLMANQFPTDPDNPATYDDKIDDAAFNARVIRFTGNYVYKTIFLPNQETVISLVQDPTISALRRAGYRVLMPGDKDFEQATPVSVSIAQFWLWQHMSGVQIAASCKYDITVTLQDNGAPKAHRFSGDKIIENWVTIGGADHINAIKLAITDYQVQLENEMRLKKN